MPWIQRDWDCHNEIVESGLLLNRCPEFKGIETKRALYWWHDHHIESMPWIQRDWDGNTHFKCGSQVNWIDALNSKGLRPTDLSKVAIVQLLNRCPEFKGIETETESLPQRVPIESMPWIQRDWDKSAIALVLFHVPLNRCPEFKGIETDARLMAALCGIESMPWIQRDWDGCCQLCLLAERDWIDALNSKGLRPRLAGASLLSLHWIDALNSKGLRPILTFTLRHGLPLNRCPEFKGIETANCARNSCGKLLNRCPEFKGIETTPFRTCCPGAGYWIDALNSKGLRRIGVNDCGHDENWIDALNSKGLRLPAVGSTYLKRYWIDALNSKGLRRRKHSSVPFHMNWIDALNSKGLRRVPPAVYGRLYYWIDALNSKGLRQNHLHHVADRLLNRCPEFKGIETGCRCRDKHPRLLNRCPEFKGIET